jgi:hypothetical protein
MIAHIIPDRETQEDKKGMTRFRSECQNRILIPHLQLQYRINSLFISVKHVLSPYAKNTE